MLQFNSLSDFIAMGGYGEFVWSSYAIAVLLAIYLYVAPYRRHRVLLKQLAESKVKTALTADLGEK